MLNLSVLKKSSAFEEAKKIGAGQMSSAFSLGEPVSPFTAFKPQTKTTTPEIATKKIGLDLTPIKKLSNILPKISDVLPVKGFVKEALEPALDLTLRTARAGAQLASTPIAYGIDKAQGGDISYSALADENYKMAKEMIKGDRYWGQTIDEAAKLYLEKRNVKDIKDVKLQDIGVLASLGFFHFLGDPFLEATAISRLAKGAKEVALWKKVGQIKKTLPAGTKILKPNTLEIPIAKEAGKDILKVKLKPFKSEIVIEGFKRRGWQPTWAPTKAKALPTGTFDDAVKSLQSLVKKETGLITKATMLGDDLVLSPSISTLGLKASQKIPVGLSLKEVETKPLDLSAIKETAKPQLRTQITKSQPQQNVQGQISQKLPSELPAKVQNDVLNSYTDIVAKDEDVVNRVITVLREAKDVRPIQERLFAQERGKRLTKAQVVRDVAKGEKGFFAEKAQLKGDLPKAQFETLRKTIKQVDIDSLFTKVADSPLISEWDKFAAREGLSKVFGEMGGKIPSKNEIKLLEKVFGEDLTKALLDKRTMLEKLKDAGYQLVNIPRSIMASFDLSAPLRQGIFFIDRPKQFAPAFAQMFKNFGSEKVFKATQEIINQNPNRQLMSDSGLALTDLGYDLSAREEAFMSSWAEKIPLIGKGVRASERAYVSFLNKLRADVFDDLINKAEKLGLNPKKNRDLANKIAKFVNAATGRGSLGKLESAAVQLNSVFFSPRLMSSRLTLLNPIYYITQPKFVRQEALKSLFSFGAIALTITGLLSLNKGVESEPNMTNADWGKVKIGNTRIDMLGGFQQYIRLAAQLVSGKIESSTTGKTMVLGEGYGTPNRMDILLRALEYKLSPIASFINGWIKGENALGEEFKIDKEVKNRFTPMAAQDTIDLAKDNPKLLPLSVLAVFGAGLQTYSERTIEDIQKEIKKEVDAGKLSKEAGIIKYKNEVDKFERREKTIRMELPEVEYKKELKLLKDNGVLTEEEAIAEFTEYKDNQLLEKNKKDEALDEIEKGKKESGFIDQVLLYAEAIGTDPLTAFNRIFTGQKIRRLDNGTIIVKRMPFEESQRVKTERGAVKGLILDHTIPLQLGGSNSKSNLKLVPEPDWEEYTQVENYLGGLLRDEKINKKEAQSLIKDYKEGIISKEKILNK